MADASCATSDPDAFFPNKGESTTAPKRVCASCPVSGDCLTWALAKPQKQDMYGIAGGLTVDERRSLRRKAKKAAA